MAVSSGLLPDGPDDVHVLVDDLVVGEPVWLHLLAEDDGRLSVSLEPESSRDVIGAAPECVASWGRSNKLQNFFRLGGNGAMESALACCAGGPGLIPAVGMVGSSRNIQMIFLPLRSNVVGKKMSKAL